MLGVSSRNLAGTLWPLADRFSVAPGGPGGLCFGVRVSQSCPAWIQCLCLSLPSSWDYSLSTFCYFKIVTLEAGAGADHKPGV